MNLNPIKANMTELEYGGLKILFSYKTPVAMITSTFTAFKTEKKWSATTTRHINTWLKMYEPFNGAIEKPQEFFDNLLKGVKL